MPVRIGTGMSTLRRPRRARTRRRVAARERLGGAAVRPLRRLRVRARTCCDPRRRSTRSTRRSPRRSWSAAAPQGVLGDGREVEHGHRGLASGRRRWARATATAFHAAVEQVEEGVVLTGMPDLDGRRRRDPARRPRDLPGRRGAARPLGPRCRRPAARRPGVRARLAGRRSALFLDGEVRRRRRGRRALRRRRGPARASRRAPRRSGPELTITAAEGNVILELAAGRRYEKLQEVVEELPEERAAAARALRRGAARDRRRAQQARLRAGRLPGRGPDRRATRARRGRRRRAGPPGPGRAPARPRRGVAPTATCARALGDRARRLGGAARRARWCSPATAAARRCSARRDHDAGAVAEALGGAPSAGFFAAGEIGPVGGECVPARLHRDRRALRARSRARHRTRMDLAPARRVLLTGATGGLGHAIARGAGRAGRDADPHRPAHRRARAAGRRARRPRRWLRPRRPRRDRRAARRGRRRRRPGRQRRAARPAGPVLDYSPSRRSTARSTSTCARRCARAPARASGWSRAARATSCSSPRCPARPHRPGGASTRRPSSACAASRSGLREDLRGTRRRRLGRLPRLHPRRRHVRGRPASSSRRASAPGRPRTSPPRSCRPIESDRAEIDVAPLSDARRRRVRPASLPPRSRCSSAALGADEDRRATWPRASAPSARPLVRARPPASCSGAPGATSATASRLRPVCPRARGRDRAPGSRRPGAGRRTSLCRAWRRSRTTTSSESISSSAMCGSPRIGVRMCSSSRRCTSRRLDVGRAAAPGGRRRRARGAARRRRRQHDVVGHHDRVLALRDCGEHRHHDQELQLRLLGALRRLQGQAASPRSGRAAWPDVRCGISLHITPPTTSRDAAVSSGVRGVTRRVDAMKCLQRLKTAPAAPPSRVGARPPRSRARARPPGSPRGAATPAAGSRSRAPGRPTAHRRPARSRAGPRP